MTPNLIAFSEFFSLLDEKNLSNLGQVYTDDIVFVDPVHKVSGLEKLSVYFQELCVGLKFCRFVFHSHSETDEVAWLVWTMYYAHPKIAGGKELALEGATELRFNGDKVCYQRDFYDMGAMIYEHIPVIGSLIRCIKSRLS